MTSAPDDLTALRNGIAAVLVDASTYPHAVQPHILGQDLGRLIAAVTDAAVHHVRKAQAEALREAADGLANTIAHELIEDAAKGSPHATSYISCTAIDVQWLRDRASRIEQGDGGDRG
jgi:hypothetical protein